MMLTPEIVADIRRQFVVLGRIVADRPAAFLDGPAGTQVPNSVVSAMAHYLQKMNANHGGRFLTSLESDAMLATAHQIFADFLNASDPGEVYFGQNMTSLTFALSRAIARTWKPGDEIVITQNAKPVAQVVPLATSNQLQSRQPGSAKGMLTIVAEDDEHLEDFREYMP